MTDPVIYTWDTSVFIAWLSAEATAPLDDIELVIREIDEGKATLLVAVTVYSEILEAKYTQDQIKLFRDFLRRSNVYVAETTIAIAERAGRLRSELLSSDRKLKTPDATFLATAIVHKASVLHSLDSDMLALNEDKLVDGLKIVRPRPLSGHRSLLMPPP